MSPNYNPTPKAEFVKSPANIASHHTLVENEVLRRHIEVALLEMTRQVVDKAPPEMGAAAAGHLRILGAHDFINIFYNLAEQAAATPKNDQDNLPANVRSINPKKN